MKQVRTEIFLNTTNPSEIQEALGQMEHFGFLPTQVDIGAGFIAGYCQKEDAESLFAVEGVIGVVSDGEPQVKVTEAENIF